MLRVLSVAVILAAGMSSALAQGTKPKTPHEIAEASRVLAEKRESCRVEAKAQPLSAYQRRKYRIACLKR
jgi:hypothetical protein